MERAKERERLVRRSCLEALEPASEPHRRL